MFDDLLDNRQALLDDKKIVILIVLLVYLF